MNAYNKKLMIFNKRNDYKIDIKTAKLLLNFCEPNFYQVSFIGTGLGGDIKIISKLQGKKVIGVEPQKSLQLVSEKKYKKIDGEFYKMNLGEYVKLKKKINGIFLFVHSFNHIPETQIRSFGNAITKNSFVIIINPNPEIQKIIGKTDKTVIEYRKSSYIEKILGCKIIFDFFYNPVKLKSEKIHLREAILLKRV